MDYLEIAKLLDTRRNQIVEQITQETLQNPFWVERFGEAVREKILFDTDYNVSTIVKAIRYRSPMILDDYAVWLRKTLVGMRCSTGQVRETFSHSWSVIASHMPTESHPVIYDYIQSGMHALSYSNPNIQRIASVHNELAEDLAAATFDSHWHWQAAYRDDGRIRASYDLWFCIDYLIDALGLNNTEILSRHLRWQRDRSIARGLSTVHIQQLAWLLSEAANRRLPPAPASDVQRVLEASVAALPYDNESCRALMAAQDQIAGEVALSLVQAGLASGPEQAAMEIGWYLAYINDCLALNDPAGLIGYTRWMQHWFAGHGLPDTPLRQSYTAFGDAFERYLPQYAAHAARAILHAAQSVL